MKSKTESMELLDWNGGYEEVRSVQKKRCDAKNGCDQQIWVAKAPGERHHRAHGLHALKFARQADAQLCFFNPRPSVKLLGKFCELEADISSSLGIVSVSFD